MCVRIYLELRTSSARVRLAIQLIRFADFTYNTLANYLHTISRISCSRRRRHRPIKLNEYFVYISIWFLNFQLQHCEREKYF